MKSKSLLVSCLGLTLVLLAAYANHFQNDFHFDDFHTVTGNPFIRDLANVPRFFRDPSLFSTLPDHQTWRPVVSVSLAIDYWLGHSLKPFYFHLSTFCWFVLQAILMFFLFRRIMDRADPHPSNLWTALLAAAFYGLHPANAETVNYVIQRGDLYCTLGIVASLLCFARAAPETASVWLEEPLPDSRRGASEARFRAAVASHSTVRSDLWSRAGDSGCYGHRGKTRLVRTGIHSHISTGSAFLPSAAARGS